MADVSKNNPPQVGGIYKLVDIRYRIRETSDGCCGCEFEYLGTGARPFKMTPKAQSTRSGCGNLYCGYPYDILLESLINSRSYNDFVLVEVSVPMMEITGHPMVIGEL